jgi:hypothetical protein
LFDSVTAERLPTMNQADIIALLRSHLAMGHLDTCALLREVAPAPCDCGMVDTEEDILRAEVEEAKASSMTRDDILAVLHEYGVDLESTDRVGHALARVCAANDYLRAEVQRLKDRCLLGAIFNNELDSP